MVEFKLVPHAILPNRQVVELWHRGVFIGQVTSDDGPGVRVISKYGLHVSACAAGHRPVVLGSLPEKAGDPNFVTVKIGG